MDTDIGEILNFWFGEIKDGLTEQDRNSFWFMPNREVDEVIREKFEELVIQAGAGKLASWESDSKGSLALIILLDQFTRNIYCRNKEAFRYDAEARKICTGGIAKGFDKELEVIERCFFYLPLEHSENLDDQNKCVELFEDLLVTANRNQIAIIKNSLDYAILHRDIIQRFGRFPHRNKALNRQSSKEELDFLSKQGNKFGQ
ncbi:MAG: DUF924 domain-containing protein [Candidatus Dadabacteria bacterium]|nr:DUF924 domain-containing protein [Candidatus Dadabacteria bacterium]NIS10247.1 DUF924 domain-containing protein [Candidatus Dadabacteria bacterium]NIV42997.1 DUF924 family protein [Candidatus Dadabacteria bacterium]NIX16622.1 DUF924 family protein [Candidatus Dadabacteria bacterium]NIY23163.1 DUF924 family protein [Candidatus Dadabacteria bacterium]